jgi:hypothetical protein
VDQEEPREGWCGLPSTPSRQTNQEFPKRTWGHEGDTLAEICNSPCTSIAGEGRWDIGDWVGGGRVKRLMAVDLLRGK